MQKSEWTIATLQRLRDRDLFVPALGLASAISLVTVLAARWLLMENESHEWGLLVLGFLVLVQVAAAAAWLRREGRSS